MSTRRRSPLLSLVVTLALAGCAQHAPGSNATTSSSAAPAPIVAAPGMPAKGGAAAAKAEAEETLPLEKFSDGARSFATVKQWLTDKYWNSGLTEDELYRAAVQGMIENIDPKMRKWNKLLSPAERKALDSELSGEIVGIGVNIDFDEPSGYTDVISVLAGSPAEKAGMLAGDKIIALDGKLYKGKKVDDLVHDLRGKAGETVSLRVLRADQLLTVPIVRGVVRVEELTAIALPGGAALIDIHSFTDRTPALLRTALEAAQKRGDTSLIIDLRQCQGGKFESAIALAEMLLPKGATIASLKKRDGDETFTAKGTQLLPAVPTAVLVSHDTASGAELLTAALQEGRRAKVVGANTFGKWTVQNLEELPNGYGVKYTLGFFYAPSGKSYQGVGITPDIEVDRPSDEIMRCCATTDPVERLAKDVELRTAVAVLRP